VAWLEYVLDFTILVLVAGSGERFELLHYLANDVVKAL